MRSKVDPPLPTSSLQPSQDEIGVQPSPVANNVIFDFGELEAGLILDAAVRSDFRTLRAPLPDVATGQSGQLQFHS